MEQVSKHQSTLHRVSPEQQMEDLQRRLAMRYGRDTQLFRFVCPCEAHTKLDALMKGCITVKTCPACRRTFYLRVNDEGMPVMVGFLDRAQVHARVRTDETGTTDTPPPVVTLAPSLDAAHRLTGISTVTLQNQLERGARQGRRNDPLDVHSAWTDIWVYQGEIKAELLPMVFPEAADMLPSTHV